MTVAEILDDHCNITSIYYLLDKEYATIFGYPVGPRRRKHFFAETLRHISPVTNVVN